MGRSLVEKNEREDDRFFFRPSDLSRIYLGEEDELYIVNIDQLRKNECIKEYK